MPWCSLQHPLLPGNHYNCASHTEMVTLLFYKRKEVFLISCACSGSSNDILLFHSAYQAVTCSLNISFTPRIGRPPADMILPMDWEEVEESFAMLWSLHPHPLLMIKRMLIIDRPSFNLFVIFLYSFMTKIILPPGPPRTFRSLLVKN